MKAYDVLESYRKMVNHIYQFYWPQVGPQCLPCLPRRLAMHDLQTQTDEEEVAMEKFAPPALPPITQSEYKAMVKFSKEKKKQELEEWAERDYQAVESECRARASRKSRKGATKRHRRTAKAQSFRPSKRCENWSRCINGCQKGKGNSMGNL